MCPDDWSDHAGIGIWMAVYPDAFEVLGIANSAGMNDALWSVSGVHHHRSGCVSLPHRIPADVSKGTE